jgi:hypothetical protein
MTAVLVKPLDPDADIRWRDWQARGAAADRHSARILRTVTGVLAVGLLVRLVLQLV